MFLAKSVVLCCSATTFVANPDPDPNLSAGQPDPLHMPYHSNGRANVMEYIRAWMAESEASKRKPH